MANTNSSLVLDPHIDWSLTVIRKMSIMNGEMRFDLDAKLLPTHPSFNNYVPTEFGVYIELELIFPKVTHYSLINLDICEPFQVEFLEDNEAQIFSISQKGQEYTIEIDLDVIYETLNLVKLNSEPPILKYGKQITN